ncbi:ABC transporter permease [Rhodoplanes roseus]|uniref:ABC transporter permease n=1 Tax=Rhodoplanes roseus TaxID=29409 RepID=A0A327KYJ5_9BRAD|nr:ABC transporter permease subunit [Rhodoplanes roseus]RAI43919.1 ABC transporter permease [Rhodoplanes roseus]
MTNPTFEDVAVAPPRGAIPTVRSPVDRSAPSGLVGLLAAATWLAAAGTIRYWPDVPEVSWDRTEEFALLLAAGASTIAVLTIAAQWLAPLRRVRSAAPWLVVIGLIFAVWEVATAKTAVLPMPFFPPPQAIFEVLIDDHKRLLDCVLASGKLLAGGYVIGATLGFVAGVAIGWSVKAGYWIHPILRFIGPLPATAWLPLAFFVFPTSLSASTFLIALATGFPVTVLTWSGVAGVNSTYYDVGRTLGASSRFLVFKVAIPAAMPYVFVGLFMGLGNSFAVLVVAEMLGVKSGLGWYLQWSQGWAAYANMYTALFIMALVCSGLITLLFRVRDSLLSWQKGLVKW